MFLILNPASVAALLGVAIGMVCGLIWKGKYFWYTASIVFILVSIGGFLFGRFVALADHDMHVIYGKEPFQFWALWLPVAIMSATISFSSYMLRVWAYRKRNHS